MGHGVAQVTAMATSPEYSVVAIDGSQESIDAGKQRIDQSLSKMLGRKVKKGLITEEDAQAEKTGIASRISYASDVSYLADCDLVIEAITENPDIKFGLFKDLARVTRPDCILASNTSSLSITVGVGARHSNALPPGLSLYCLRVFFFVGNENRSVSRNRPRYPRPSLFVVPMIGVSRMRSRGHTIGRYLTSYLRDCSQRGSAVLQSDPALFNARR